MTALAKEVVASYRDAAKQRELIGQLRPYYLDQVFTMPFVSGTAKQIVSPRLRNFQPQNKIPYVHFFRGWMYTWIDDDWSFAR